MDSRTAGPGEVRRPVLVTALGSAWAAVREYRRAYLLAGVAATLLVLGLLPFDAMLSDVARLAPGWVQRLSAELAIQGRFLRSTGVAGLALVLLGMVSRRPRWRDAGVACLLAGSLAGVASLGLKPVFGRARPDSGFAAGFHWFEGQPDAWRSFPSGHALTNSASAVAVGAVVPWLSVPVGIFAVAVVASRVILGRHYPSDVVAGGALGAAIGLAIGLALRRRR